MPFDKFDGQIDEVYLHVGNSGLTIAVADAGHGPELCTRTSAFGNLVHETRALITVDGLVKIRDRINRALASHTFSADYCHAAEPMSDSVCGSNVSYGGQPPKV